MFNCKDDGYSCCCRSAPTSHNTDLFLFYFVCVCLDIIFPPPGQKRAREPLQTKGKKKKKKEPLTRRVVAVAARRLGSSSSSSSVFRDPGAPKQTV